MNICVVTASYPRVDGEHAGNFVGAQVSALRAAGHTVDVIGAHTIASSLFYGGGAPDELERGGLRRYLAAARFTMQLTAAVASHLAGTISTAAPTGSRRPSAAPPGSCRASAASPGSPSASAAPPGSPSASAAPPGSPSASAAPPGSPSASAAPSGSPSASAAPSETDSRFRTGDCDLIIAHWLAPSALAAVIGASGASLSMRARMRGRDVPRARVTRARVPILAIAHGGDVHLLRRLRLLAPVLHLLHARGVRLAFVSDELRAIAKRAAPRLSSWLDEAIVQPMGIDVARFAALRGLRRTSDVPTIVVIARLVPVKGVDVVVRAVQQLRRPVRLVIAGAGPERENLEALAAGVGAIHDAATHVGAMQNTRATHVGAMQNIAGATRVAAIDNAATHEGAMQNTHATHVGAIHDDVGAIHNAATHVGAMQNVNAATHVGAIHNIDAATHVGAIHNIDAATHVGAMQKNIAGASRVAAIDNAATHVGAIHNIDATTHVGAIHNIDAATHVGAMQDTHATHVGAIHNIDAATHVGAIYNAATHVGAMQNIDGATRVAAIDNAATHVGAIHNIDATTHVGAMQNTHATHVGAIHDDVGAIHNAATHVGAIHNIDAATHVGAIHNIDAATHVGAIHNAATHVGAMQNTHATHVGAIHNAATHARIQFIGAVDANARDQLLREATCVVIPSRVLPNGRTEGTPMIALEALAAGIPVIASAVGGLRDLAPDSAPTHDPAITCVPPDDPAALAMAIERVLAAPPPAPIDMSDFDTTYVAARLLAHATGLTCEADDTSGRRTA